MPSTIHLSHLPHLSDSLRQELMIINSFLRLRASDEAFRPASDIEIHGAKGRSSIQYRNQLRRQWLSSSVRNVNLANSPNKSKLRSVDANLFN